MVCWWSSCFNVMKNTNISKLSPFDGHVIWWEIILFIKKHGDHLGDHSTFYHTPHCTNLGIKRRRWIEKCIKWMQKCCTEYTWMKPEWKGHHSYSGSCPQQTKRNFYVFIFKREAKITMDLVQDLYIHIYICKLKRFKTKIGVEYLIIRQRPQYQLRCISK